MPPEEEHRIEAHLDGLLAQRGMTLTELADRVGVTVVNLSILKNGRARAIRFSTLTAICRELGCQPGDLADLPALAAGARTGRREFDSHGDSVQESMKPASGEKTSCTRSCQVPLACSLERLRV